MRPSRPPYHRAIGVRRGAVELYGKGQLGCTCKAGSEGTWPRRNSCSWSYRAASFLLEAQPPEDTEALGPTYRTQTPGSEDTDRSCKAPSENSESPQAQTRRGSQPVPTRSPHYCAPCSTGRAHLRAGHPSGSAQDTSWPLTDSAPDPAAEVVRAAKPASVSITLPPPIVTARARIEGDPSATYAFSSKDPDRAYLMRHRIVPLSDVIPSQLDSLQPNPDYPSELQPRDRTRQASRHQIQNIAKRLSPAMLIEDARSLKSGPPIVGDDMVVESGSGRVLAIRFAEEHLPDQYQAYKQAVTDIAPSLGIDSEQVAGMKTPVLVRERVTPVDRRAFAEEANSPDVMSASPVEDALREARLVPDSALTQLEALGNEDPDKNIDTIINSAAFARTIGAYMQSLPPNGARCAS